CTQTKPSMVSSSSCTRAIDSDGARARCRTSGRQPSSQNPATDFINASIRGISLVPARRIIRSSTRDGLGYSALTLFPARTGIVNVNVELDVTTSQKDFSGVVGSGTNTMIRYSAQWRVHRGHLSP